MKNKPCTRGNTANEYQLNYIWLNKLNASWNAKPSAIDTVKLSQNAKKTPKGSVQWQ